MSDHEQTTDPDAATGCADDALPGTSAQWRAALPADAGEMIPCRDLDLGTDPCPFCGARYDDACGVEWGAPVAWRVSPEDATNVQRWEGGAWVSDCFLATAEQATKWVVNNIKEARTNV